MKLPWYIPVAVGLILFLLGAGAGYRWQLGAVAKQEAITADLKAEIARASLEANAKLQAEREGFLAHNATIRGEYEKSLAAIESSRDDLARRLLLATRTGSAARSAGEASDRQRTADASAFASREAELTEAFGRYDAACQIDAAQLDAILSSLSPQL